MLIVNIACRLSDSESNSESEKQSKSYLVFSLSISTSIVGKFLSDLDTCQLMLLDQALVSLEGILAWGLWGLWTFGWGDVFCCS